MRRTVPIPRTSVRTGRSRTGLGLFAVEEIKPGMYLEYIGRLIPTSLADTMTEARYLFELNNHWTIDGSPRSNLARYINHGCVPNCESVQRGKRVFIKALRSIPPGEELTYDYGTEYFDEFIRSRGCRCAACT